MRLDPVPSRLADHWRGPRDGYSGPHTPAPARDRRKAAWRRRPIRPPAPDPDNGQIFSDRAAALIRRRTAGVPRGKLFPVLSKTTGGTGATTRAPARRIRGGNQSSVRNRKRLQLRESRSAGADDDADSVPGYGVQRRNRFQHRDVWDRARWSVESRPWHGTECHRRRLCSGMRWRRAVPEL